MGPRHGHSKNPQMFSDKVNLMYLIISTRRCLTLDHKLKVVNPFGLIVVGVVRGMRIGVWSVEIVVIDVVRVAT